jgi:ribonuclease HII
VGKKPSIKSIEDSIKTLDVEAAVEKLREIETLYGMNLSKLIEKYLRKREREEKELGRYLKMLEYERYYSQKGVKKVAGLDEAGRGPLAGPVIAASVILPEDVFIKGLNDSKKLSSQKRDELYEIIQRQAVSIGIGIVDEKCIDEVNILNATKLAMKTAVESMNVKPDFLLIDAVELKELEIKQKPIIKGDSLSASIAAASIVAKVTRDRIMEEADKSYPEYGFFRHKGYGTEEHIHAIKKYGICPIHRISFTKNFVG